MSVFIITRNEVEVYVRKMKVKELKPDRIKNTTCIKEHRLGLDSHVFVVCNKEGEIKFNHPKQKYKIHFISKDDTKNVRVLEELQEEPKQEEPKLEEPKVKESKIEEPLYEDYYTFPIVDYLEETMFE